MTCAACAARVEKKLSALGDVTATVSLATEKAKVALPPAVPVERLIEAVEQAGYEAELTGPAAAYRNGGADAGSGDAFRVVYLRRRLIVALVFFVPLSDLSVLIVLREDLGAVPQAISLARATLATIRRNLAWAFGYNVAAIPVAAAGLLNPLIAGAAMAAASAFVVASSVRLRRFAATGPGGRRQTRPAGRVPRPDPGVTGGNISGEEVTSCPG
jgi:cation transport ATPase